MRMKYDREGDVLDILIRDGQIHHAEDHGQVIINYDDENRVVEDRGTRCEQGFRKHSSGGPQGSKKKVIGIVNVDACT